MSIGGGSRTSSREILEIDLEELTETSLFKEDHDADSLRAIEISPRWSASSAS